MLTSSSRTQVVDIRNKETHVKDIKKIYLFIDESLIIRYRNSI